MDKKVYISDVIKDSLFVKGFLESSNWEIIDRLDLLNIYPTHTNCVALYIDMVPDGEQTPETIGKRYYCCNVGSYLNGQFWQKRLTYNDYKFIINKQMKHARYIYNAESETKLYEKMICDVLNNINNDNEEYLMGKMFGMFAADAINEETYLESKHLSML